MQVRVQAAEMQAAAAAASVVSDDPAALVLPSSGVGSYPLARGPLLEACSPALVAFTGKREWTALFEPPLARVESGMQPPGCPPAAWVAVPARDGSVGAAQQQRKGGLHECGAGGPVQGAGSAAGGRAVAAAAIIRGTAVSFVASARLLLQHAPLAAPATTCILLCCSAVTRAANRMRNNNGDNKFKFICTQDQLAE